MVGELALRAMSEDLGLDVGLLNAWRRQSFVITPKWFEYSLSRMLRSLSSVTTRTSFSKDYLNRTSYIQ